LFSIFSFLLFWFSFTCLSTEPPLNLLPNGCGNGHSIFFSGGWFDPIPVFWKWSACVGGPPLHFLLRKPHPFPPPPQKGPCFFVLFCGSFPRWTGIPLSPRTFAYLLFAAWKIVLCLLVVFAGLSGFFCLLCPLSLSTLVRWPPRRGLSVRRFPGLSPQSFFYIVNSIPAPPFFPPPPFPGPVCRNVIFVPGDVFAFFFFLSGHFDFRGNHFSPCCPPPPNPLPPPFGAVISRFYFVVHVPRDF